ncbi:hypothetical protein AHiyo8_17330 [Arthrobacter sp. Hiyo8]|nr:hypothetical protein AHiyo8_17330 [Arthrobacter sp. Hiyo8]
MPATAVDHGQGPEQTRTLVITAGENGGYTSSLMRGAGTTLDSLSTVAAGRSIVGSPGQERLVADDDATASIRNAVATIVAGTGVDPRPALEQLGAGFVVLKSADTAAPLTANRIDSVPGLVAVAKPIPGGCGGSRRSTRPPRPTPKRHTVSGWWTQKVPSLRSCLPLDPLPPATSRRAGRTPGGAR